MGKVERGSVQTDEETMIRLASWPFRRVLVASCGWLIATVVTVLWECSRMSASIRLVSADGNGIGAVSCAFFEESVTLGVLPVLAFVGIWSALKRRESQVTPK